MTSIYETIERPGIRNNGHDPIHKSSYMIRPSESSLPPSRPYTVGATGPGSAYGSSYLKKLQENPAPSIVRSSSFAGNRPAQAALPTNMHETAAPSNNQDRNNVTQSHSLQRAFPWIDTSISNLSQLLSPKPPPSPAETINAILMEETNNRAASPFYARGAQASSSYSPPNLRRHSSPSPERYTSRAAHENTPAFDENFRKPFHQSTYMPNRNANPPSSARYIQSSFESASPPSPRPKKPLSPSDKDNIETGYSWTVNKLPHEERHNMKLESQRQIKHMPVSYSQAPFWTQVSVKVSAALLKAGKSRKIAEVAQIAVVQAGEEQYSTDQQALNFVASRASLAVMEAGGDANTAAIATVACLQGDTDIPSTEEQFKNEFERVVANVKNKASEVVQTTYDGSAKAVNVISEFATKGIKDLQYFTDKSYRQYRIYQRRYARDRERALRALNDAYRDSRNDDYSSGRQRSRGGTSRRRGASRARTPSPVRQRSSSRAKSATIDRRRSSSRARTSSPLSSRQRSSSRARTPPPMDRQRSSSRTRGAPRPMGRQQVSARTRSSRVDKYDSDDSYEDSRRRRSYSKSGSDSLSDSQSSVSTSSYGSSTYTSSSGSSTNREPRRRNSTR